MFLQGSLSNIVVFTFFLESGGDDWGILGVPAFVPERHTSRKNAFALEANLETNP